MIATAEGNGPVNALDTALRTALGDRYPALASVHLTDYKVRVLDTAKGTGAITRVLVDSTNGDRIVDHDRRQREHHRGVLAGALRLVGLRLAPRDGCRVAHRHAHRPVRALQPRGRSRARRRTSRRACTCRQRRAGVPIVPATSRPASPREHLTRSSGAERRVRALARGAGTRPLVARARTSRPTTRSRSSARWR